MRILVGHDRAEHNIHANLLRTCCSFFAERLQDTSDEDTKIVTLHLPDDDPGAFKIFAHWLYKEELRPISATMKYKEKQSEFVKDHYATANPYFELYYMAEKWGLQNLKNDVLNLIRAYIGEEKFVFSP